MKQCGQRSSSKQACKREVTGEDRKEKICRKIKAKSLTDESMYMPRLYGD